MKTAKTKSRKGGNGNGNGVKLKPYNPEKTKTFKQLLKMAAHVGSLPHGLTAGDLIMFAAKKGILYDGKSFYTTLSDSEVSQLHEMLDKPKDVEDTDVFTTLFKKNWRNHQVKKQVEIMELFPTKMTSSPKKIEYSNVLQELVVELYGSAGKVLYADAKIYNTMLKRHPKSMTVITDKNTLGIMVAGKFVASVFTTATPRVAVGNSEEETE